MRNQSAYTTTEVRRQPFHLLIAPDRDGKAQGKLYLDHGDSIEQAATSETKFKYEGGELSATGTFGYTVGGDKISIVTVLGHDGELERPRWTKGRAGPSGGDGWQECQDHEWEYNEEAGSVTIQMDHSLSEELFIRI